MGSLLQDDESSARISDSPPDGNLTAASSAIIPFGHNERSPGCRLLPRVLIIKPTLSANPTEQHFVNTQLLELLGKQNRQVVVAVLIVGAILTGVGVRPTTIPFWVAWWALTLVCLVIQDRLRRQSIPYKDPDGVKQMLRKNIRIEFFSGIGFSLCLLSFPQLGDSERQIMTLVMLIVVVGGVPNTAGNRSVFWAFAAPVVLPLSITWIAITGQNYSLMQGRTIGLLMLVPVIPVLHVYCKLSWELFEESCRLRFRESDLNARLTEALAQAEQANRAKTRFLAAASHDLRQPLHVIAFIASGLNMRNLDPKSQEMLRLMTQATDSLQVLLDSLLDISRLDSGLMEPRLEKVDVEQLVRQWFLEVSPLATAKGLVPRFEISPSQAKPGAWTTYTDPTLLLRILNNLFQNAVKYTREGHVSLLVTLEAEHFNIVVSDSGMGVAKEHHEDIFKEFYQVENQERDLKKGLGLGLAMVRRIANLLDMIVSFDSTPGQGSRIALKFLRQPIPPQGISIAPEKTGLRLSADQRPLQFSGLKILVIDDNLAVLKASALLFEELACECLHAEDLEQARQCMAKFLPGRPDLIIADLRLRGQVNGIDVIETLQAERSPGTDLIPAILLTGDIAPDRLLLAKRAGLRLCQKPLTLDLLRYELELATRPTEVSR